MPALVSRQDPGTEHIGRAGVLFVNGAADTWIHRAAAAAVFRVIRPRTGNGRRVSRLLLAALRKTATRRAAKKNGLAWKELRNMLDAIWNFGPGNPACMPDGRKGGLGAGCGSGEPPHMHRS